MIEGADLVFQSKKATGDYHDEMNSERFEEWFHDQLMLNIQPNTLIVIDNASYHSRRLEAVPTTNIRKGEMQDWLTAHNIQFQEHGTICIVYDLRSYRTLLDSASYDE